MACIGKEYSYNIAERIENILDSEFMLKYSNLKNVTSFLVEIAILLPVDEAKVFELQTLEGQIGRLLSILHSKNIPLYHLNMILEVFEDFSLSEEAMKNLHLELERVSSLSEPDIQSSLIKFLLRDYYFSITFAVAKLYQDNTVPLDQVIFNLGQDSSGYLPFLHQAFQNKPSLVLVGPPCMGKTTVMKRLCLDWAMDKLSEFKYVLYTQLPTFEAGSSGTKIPETLLDLALEPFEPKFDEYDLDRDTVVEILKEAASQTLILISGLTKSWMQHAGKEIATMMQENAQNANSFTVMLCATSETLGEVPDFHAISLLPLTERQQLQYVRQYMNQKQASAAKMEIASQELLEAQSMLHLTKAPLLLHLFCQEYEHLPALTPCSLLVAVCNRMITNYQLQQRHANGNPTLDGATWMRNKEIVDLGRAALRRILKGDGEQFLFTYPYLQKYKVGKLAFDVGFLQRHSDASKSHFPAQALQKLFAAIAICNKLLAHKDVKNCGSFQKFLEGLTNRKDEDLEDVADLIEDLIEYFPEIGSKLEPYADQIYKHQQQQL